MKILAKSALRADQIRARQNLPVDGIEIILLSGDLQNYSAARDLLLRTADDFPVVGLEAPCEDNELVINPIAEDRPQQTASHRYLGRCVELINEVAQKTKCKAYFQYQYSFDAFEQGKPGKNAPREILLQRIMEFHQELQRSSDIPIQIENGTPIDLRKGVLSYQPVTAELEDFDVMNLPLALDITHLAISLYTWSQAVRDGDLYRVATPHGPVWIEMTLEQHNYGQSIRENYLSLQSGITNMVCHYIARYKKIIASLQFSNAKPGVGTDVHDEGYAGTDGLLRLPDIFQRAILPQNIPYVIPEYEEKDYLNPVHQQDAITMIYEL